VTPDTEVAAFGKALAFATPGRTSMFSRVLCMTDAARLGDVLTWYQARAVTPRFELCPHNAEPGLREALTARGFVHSSAAPYRRRLYALLTDIVESEETVEVRRVTPEDFETWLAIDEALFPGGDPRVRRAQILATFEAPRMQRFIAYVDGKPAALGRAEILDGVAMLNGAGTLEACRRRGCQRSLTARRLRVLRELGCDLVTCLVQPGSDSERNVRRAGLTRHSDREPWLPQNARD
jgi:hypothetical protein